MYTILNNNIDLWPIFKREGLSCEMTLITEPFFCMLTLPSYKALFSMHIVN